MKKLDLSIYGINDVNTIYHNASYDDLYDHETNPDLEGFERGFVTYSNESKIELLGVAAETIAEFGAVKDMTTRSEPRTVMAAADILLLSSSSGISFSESV